jgi:hypothetical protein
MDASGPSRFKPDTCCCTRLIVPFSFLIVSRLFHAHTVSPRLPIRATHTGNFPSSSRRLLASVAAFLICHLSFSSDDDETRRAINPRRKGQHSTVNHHRRASKAAHSSLKSIADRHHRPSAVSTVSGRIRVFSLLLSHTHMYKYVYLRTLKKCIRGSGVVL